MASPASDLLGPRASGRVDPGEFGAGDKSVRVSLGSQKKVPLKWEDSLVDLDRVLFA